MRLLVWGASPEAGWMAARFHQLGYAITWLANDAIATDITRHGKIELSDPQHHLVITDLNIVTTLDEGLGSEPESMRWIFLMMPNWALSNALIEMSQHILPQACPYLFVLSHGIGSFEKIAMFFDPKLILRGVSTQTFAFPSINDDTGHVAHEVIVSDGLGGIVLSHHEKADKMAHMLQRAGFSSVQIESRESLEWSNLLWQIQANALPTLVDADPENVYKDSRLFAIEHAQLREAMAVINRLKIQLIKLPDVNVPRLAWQIQALPKFMLARLLSPNRKPPSLRNDLVQKTGRSNAAYLNGIVAQYAYELGIPAPVNHILALSLTDVAEGRALWSQFRDQVNYLETMIRIASRH
jgi:ketopantoate reductase